MKRQWVPVILFGFFLIKKKEKVKRVLCCPQCKDKRKESVVAKIIGEIATFDFELRCQENEFARNLRLSSEILQKFINFSEWLDKEKVCIKNF